MPADLQLSCKREQKQIIFGYAERSRQSMKLIVVQVRVRVKCIVDSYPDLISTTFAIVPADLQSAGIEYKDLFNPITSNSKICYCTGGSALRRN